MTRRRERVLSITADSTMVEVQGVTIRLVDVDSTSYGWLSTALLVQVFGDVWRAPNGRRFITEGAAAAAKRARGAIRVMPRS